MWLLLPLLKCIGVMLAVVGVVRVVEVLGSRTCKAAVAECGRKSYLAAERLFPDLVCI